MINMDLVNNADLRRVARASASQLHAIQDYQPHEQVMAAAALFLTLAEHFGVSAQEAFRATTNLMNHADGQRRAEFRALRAYVEGEL